MVYLNAILLYLKKQPTTTSQKNVYVIFSSKTESSMFNSKAGRQDTRNPTIKTLCENYYSVHVRNSISGNPHETCTDIGVGKKSVLVMITMSPDDSLTTEMCRNNKTLHNMLSGVVPCSKTNGLPVDTKVPSPAC